MNVVASIQEILEKFKLLSKATDMGMLVLIPIVAGISFFLGHVQGGTTTPASPIMVTENTALLKGSMDDGGEKTPMLQGSESTPILEIDPTKQSLSEVVPGSYVASKSGTKYHLPWCPGAKQIKESNKIWFRTKEEAELAGYAPASNCKGI